MRQMSITYIEAQQLLKVRKMSQKIFFQKTIKYWIKTFVIEKKSRLCVCDASLNEDDICIFSRVQYS